MAIRYLSFDFDGCLFNSNYVKADHGGFTKHLGDAVLIHNRAFLDQIKLENADFDEVYALIGSNRQSYELDYANMGSRTTFKGSCVPAIKTICEDLDVKFNPFLIADVTANLPHGTSYNLIMQEIKDNSYFEDPKQSHATCDMDDTKRSLLFAQVQNAAAKHPQEEIIFDFFDDRDDILYGLSDLFKNHPHLLPKNVTLRLNKYTGADVNLLTSLKGTGELYSDYCEHVINMLEASSNWNVFDEYLAKIQTGVGETSSIDVTEVTAENHSNITELAEPLASVGPEMATVEFTETIDETEELPKEKEATEMTSVDYLDTYDLLEKYLEGAETDSYDSISDTSESTSDDSDIEFDIENGSEKETEAQSYALGDLSFDDSNKENSPELVEAHSIENHAGIGKPIVAAETATSHSNSAIEQAGTSAIRTQELNLNPASNPGRNQYAFHKPAQINRAPMKLPTDNLCNSSSCLVS
ncbi:hypothetical protein [Legionella sp. PC997]|uniref:hypothetical protein n=1 Tax=Legionella sp. PC997 TaxID=2755562 RepID=UPI0015FDFEB1|nr:hypothetical protein [Legionella sp. PC997]QMT60950.1 hypothetical protein HBNCFIEN_02339 [Legionella sp. PC997]